MHQLNLGVYPLSSRVVSTCSRGGNTTFAPGSVCDLLAFRSVVAGLCDGTGSFWRSSCAVLGGSCPDAAMWLMAVRV